MALTKNTINISNKVNFKLTDVFFFKLLLRTFDVIQQLRPCHARWKGSGICSSRNGKPWWCQNGCVCGVSWGISPAQILLIVQATAIGHSIFHLSSFSMFIQSRISKSVVICFFCFFLYSILLSVFSILLFSTVPSFPCSVFSLSFFLCFLLASILFLFFLCFLFAFVSILSLFLFSSLLSYMLPLFLLVTYWFFPFIFIYLFI